MKCSAGETLHITIIISIKQIINSNMSYYMLTVRMTTLFIYIYISRERERLYHGLCVFLSESFSCLLVSVVSY